MNDLLVTLNGLLFQQARCQTSNVCFTEAETSAASTPGTGETFEVFLPAARSAGTRKRTSRR